MIILDSNNNKIRFGFMDENVGVAIRDIVIIMCVLKEDSGGIIPGLLLVAAMIIIVSSGCLILSPLSS